MSNQFDGFTEIQVFPSKSGPACAGLNPDKRKIKAYVSLNDLAEGFFPVIELHLNELRFFDDMVIRQNEIGLHEKTTAERPIRVVDHYDTIEARIIQRPCVEGVGLVLGERRVLDNLLAERGDVQGFERAPVSGSKDLAELDADGGILEIGDDIFGSSRDALPSSSSRFSPYGTENVFSSRTESDDLNQSSS